ncbi:MAG TPA: 3-dehydroquinate synthase [Aggregatilineales bacterium]|nr:3-dehydroquinate synthase [Aggregatilineales bacterium]
MSPFQNPIRITVNAPNTAYPIVIGRGVIRSLPALLTERQLKGKIAVVTNTAIAPLHGEPLVKLLGGDAELITIPEGEAAKTLNTVRTLYDAFIDAELDRKSVIVALGGGVVGDMAGFAAATFLRGVAFVQIPTSLLAMVDASIGGKVGVDLPQGKNLVGAFKQPEAVIVDPDVLATLPDVEFRCGVAEVIKAGLIQDTALLDPAIYAADPTYYIERAIAFKAEIVQKDPYEENIRAYLNLGHTFGHALERVSHYAWRHGEAVAVGLLAAARLSQVHGLCDSKLPFRVEQLLKAVNLPTRFKGYSSIDIRAAMNTDKKRQSNRVRFVLLRSAGDPVLADDVPDNKVIGVLDSLRE